MEINSKELTELKKKAEQAKTQENEKQGELNSLLSQLKDVYGCASLKELDTLIEQKKKEAAEYRKKRDAGIERLKEEYSTLLEED